MVQILSGSGNHLYCGSRWSIIDGACAFPFYSNRLQDIWLCSSEQLDSPDYHLLVLYPLSVAHLWL